MIRIDAKLVRLGEARAILAGLRELGEDPQPLLATAGAILENSTRERFRTSRGPGGIPWAPTWRQRFQAAPGTGKRGKPTRKDPRNPMGPNPGGKPLIDTGGLLASVTHRVSPRRVEIGIIAKTRSAKFAYVHQFGATIVPRRAEFLVFTGPDGHKIFANKVTIPARPFLGIDDVDRQDLLEAWRAQLKGEAQ